MLKKKSKNELKWFIFYDNEIKGYYICKGGFHPYWYKKRDTTQYYCDKLNKENNI